MPVLHMFKTSLMAVPLLALHLGAAWPCGFHGGLGNTFTPMHPKSIGVALAVRDAVVAGLIDPPGDPAQAGRAGYWRAVNQLKGLQRALSSGNHESLKPVSVLFIDSGLWARLSPSENGLAMDIHTDGAGDGDVVIVTSEPVLATILDRRLSAADAIERGLMAIDGRAAEAEGTGKLIANAFVTTDAPVGKPPTVRLFGPVR